MLGGVDKPGRKGVGGEKNGQRRIKGVEETTLEPIHRTRARKRRREEYEYPGLRVKVRMGDRSSEAYIRRVQ